MEAKWYVVRTFSGHENKVKQLLESELEDHEQIKSKILNQVTLLKEFKICCCYKYCPKCNIYLCFICGYRLQCISD